MTNQKIEKSFQDLQLFCEKEEYKGWDPYDGMNSKLFQATPFKKIKLARMAWIQLFKRNPINLRPYVGITKGYNPKGIGLFLTGYCNLYQIAQSGNNRFGTPENILEKINFLADLVIRLKSDGYSGACWGYNFDWQSKAFFLPEKTPTVVATSFVAEALIYAYECTSNQRYLETAVSSADFILKDLNRISKRDNLFMFSYSPLDNRAVYNATLLGSRLLSKIFHYSQNDEHQKAAYISARAVCQTQKEDGAFLHSDQVGNKWRDNFHTGFKLESLAAYQKNCKDYSFNDNIERGFNYWVDNFFLSDGTAKYYDNSIYPIDLHCAAQAIPTLYKTDKFKDFPNLTEKIILWAINNMQNKKDGSFYFQQSRNKTMNKITYSRWPNAWMFYGISFYLFYQTKNG
ncbi:delta-aminolevulinic acid dehydratase [Salinimicrobium sp. HB62]|uniref:delta-aminolevulinic acid dehydratase n=1 Tax=Salinimicrobium sp. HB62 TaxID=3077781 RepID=UPI002D78BB7D|nr:delta-aminolevulinic acid dehydratase [Salinimicrobium sp. HB62]